MVHPMWLELTLAGLLVKLANYYTTLGAQFVFDGNTWNHSPVCQLFVFDKNTWNHTTEWKIICIWQEYLKPYNSVPIICIW